MCSLVFKAMKLAENKSGGNGMRKRIASKTEASSNSTFNIQGLKEQEEPTKGPEMERLVRSEKNLDRRRPRAPWAMCAWKEGGQVRGH